jgi:hypothetical protein
MPRQTPTKGKCELCGQMFSKQVMTRHLNKCNQVPSKTAGSAFHIVVQFPYDHRYWLHLEAATNAKLHDLDDFLRDIWLECCGHMSAFRINGQGYTAPQAVMETGDVSMNIRLDKILTPVQKFDYEYDFGSTTELKLSVVGIYPHRTKKMIGLLAHNEPINFKCMECGKPSTEICLGECMYKRKNVEPSMFCNKCSKAHKCDDGMRLPVVNSPRMGVCAFVG